MEIPVWFAAFFMDYPSFWIKNEIKKNTVIEI